MAYVGVYICTSSFMKDLVLPEIAITNNGYDTAHKNMVVYNVMHYNRGWGEWMGVVGYIHSKFHVRYRSGGYNTAICGQGKDIGQIRGDMEK